MSFHIGARKGDIADVVLLPGDPLRARYIAETFLDEIVCYSEVRGMLGFTGVYNQNRVSVQGGGMGIPSTAIYVNELISDYGVKTIVRIGTCGGISDKVNLGDIILANGASTDSSLMRGRFNHGQFAPTASFNLLRKVYEKAKSLNQDLHVGGIFSTDAFYDEGKDRWDVWSKHGVLGVEMESSALYTLCMGADVQALSILAVSDHILTGKHLAPEEIREVISVASALALNSLF